MKLLLTSVISISAMCAFAAPPLSKPAANPAGALKEVSLKSMKTAETSARLLSVTPEDALSLPVTYDLSSSAISGYPKVDGNGDGKTWKYEKTSGKESAVYEGIGVSGAADDWLILPFINFPAAPGSYTINLLTEAMFKADSFDICISPTTNVGDATVIGSFNIAGSFAFAPVSADFTVPAAGNYCIMFHATSPEPGMSLYIADINVVANETGGNDGFTVPFSMTPEASEARYFSFVDANEDGITFSYDTSNSGFSYTTNSSNPNPADDYVLFPEINIPADGNYKFTWTPRGWGTSVEAMEVLFGQGDDPSTFTVAHTDRNITGTVYPREVVVYLSAGAWRPALHGISVPNQYKLLVKDFTLEATDDTPAAALPFSQTGPLTVSSSTPAFSKAFILPAASRIKVDFDHTGAAVNVGLANAPATAAANTIFTVPAASASTFVSEKFNNTDEGIRYLILTSDGSATVSNLSVTVYSETDDAYQLPFEMQPTADQFAEFMVVNANNDASTWTYYEQFGAPRYNYSNNEKADDWLVFPAINMPSVDNMVNFSLQVRGMGTAFAETFEVWEGASANVAEMIKIYSSPEVRNEAFEDFGFSYAPSHSGITYYAIRATSEPRQFHLFVKNLKVELTDRSVRIPAPAVNLMAEGLPQGSEDAKVTFTMPSVTAAGAPLAASESLTATVRSATQSLSLTGAPGASMECTITNGQGEGTITVIVSNASGASNESVTKVFTGQHVPGMVSDVAVEADATNRVATISWNLSDVGVDGGYVDPAEVTYVIRHSAGGSGYGVLATTAKGVTSYTYQIPESYPLQMHYFTVTATNVAGEGEAPTSGTGIVLGKPHSIPAVDEFANGTIELGPVGMSYPDETYTLEWYFDNPAFGFDEAANQSGRALIAFTEEAGAARGRLHLPKFDTQTDKGARVVLRVFNYPHFGPTSVFANTYNAKGVKIGEILPALQPGWVEYSFPLSEELMNLQWVEIYVDFGFDGTNDDEIWMLDRFGMEHYYETELDLRHVMTHSRVKANEKSSWQFTAGNYGKTDITFEVPTLNFTNTAGDVQQFEAVSPAEATVTLLPGQVVNLCYEPVADTALEGECFFDIAIPVENDLNPDNNYLADELTVWIQEEFVVRDLSAARSDDSDPAKVVLSWSAPQNDWGILYMDNLESWIADDQLGLFGNYDGDKLPTLMFVGNTFPGMGYPKAWQVFDYEDAGFDYPYAGYLGTVKSLIAFCPGDNVSPADDWLISPEVLGGTQVEFQVRPLHFAYGSETIEVYYSSTGNDLADFELLTTYKTQVKEATAIPYWEEVKATLPADARFFAIRYASAGIFGLQLDDVIYTPAQAEREDGRDALTYTIFRNGESIAQGVEGTSFTDNFVGNAAYQVAAEKVYGGLHPLSNTALVQTSSLDSVSASTLKVSTGVGTLSVKGAEGHALSVVAADGTVVYATSSAPSAITLNLAPALYIVTTDATPAVKALVK